MVFIRRIQSIGIRRIVDGSARRERMPMIASRTGGLRTAACFVVCCSGCTDTDSLGETDATTSATGDRLESSTGTETGAVLTSSSRGEPSTSTAGSSGDSSVGLSTGEGLPQCGIVPGVEPLASVSAPAAVEPGWGIYFRETCQRQPSGRYEVAATCDEAGEVRLTVEGTPEFESSNLPEVVTIDVAETLVVQSYGARYSVTSEDGTLLYAFATSATRADLSDDWYDGLAPLGVASQDHECASTNPQRDVTCWPAMLELTTPEGVVGAFQGEHLAVPGGWHAYVARIADCYADSFAPWDQVRFAVIHESLLSD